MVNGAQMSRITFHYNGNSPATWNNPSGNTMYQQAR